MSESVSDRFAEIDHAAMQALGSEVVDEIMMDIHNTELSLRQVAARNGVSTATVVQVARYHKLNPVTLEPTK